jgi:class 3 adenylate cyclase
MKPVERFVAASSWPTAKKSAVLALGVGLPVLLAQGAIGRLGFSHSDGAVDLRWFDFLVGCFIAHTVLTGVVSAYVAARGHEGRWTAWLFLLPYLALGAVLVYGFGVANTVTSLPLVIPVMSASIFYNDLRFGIVAGVIAVAIFVGMGVALALGGVTYAPAFLDRRLESVSSPGVLIGAGGVILPELIGGFVIAWTVTAALRRGRRRLADAHDRLKVAHGLIRRYVPEQVAEAVLSDTPEAIERHERRRLTIFFSDLVGFTDLSEELEPEDLAMVLHDYFTEMSAIAKRHGGTVDDLVGDAILVLFGAPDFTDDRDQSLRAVRMAVEMQEAMGPLNQRWASAGIPETLIVRMGINTGVATVGNFGSAERTKYTALGKQVNVAARIQSHCEPGKVLLSHATWLLVRDEIPCTPKGELTLKGLHKPMPAYEVQG